MQRERLRLPVHPTLVIAMVAGLCAPRAGAQEAACVSSSLTCELTPEDGRTKATLSWIHIPGTTVVEIFRDGALLTVVPGTRTQFFDVDVEDAEGAPNAHYEIIMRGTLFGDCALACQTSFCPSLSGDVVDGSVVLSIGNIVKEWDHFEISRNDVIVDTTVSATATTWVDPDAVLVAGNSYDYLLHPVAAPGGGLPDPTQCDASFILGYLPDGGNYDSPGQWDYWLDFSGGEFVYRPLAGAIGNLDGRWIRSIDTDSWNGHGPDDPPGPAPAGPAPGGLDVKSRPGLGVCGTDTAVLRILDPGDTGVGIGEAFPEPFIPPANSRIFLGLNLGEGNSNVLKSGITLYTRLRLSPDAPAYMNPDPSSGDGTPISAGLGHVGVYYKGSSDRPTEGDTAGAAIGLNSTNRGGDLLLSTNPGTDVDAAGTLEFITVWMTVRGGGNLDTYDVNVYLNGSTEPIEQVSGTGLTLGKGAADFGFAVVNYIAIGSSSLSDDAMLEIDFVAYKLGVWPPGVSQCPSAVSFRRGDVNEDGETDLSDPIRVLEFLFQGTFTVNCLEAANADDDASLELTDVIYLLTYAFTGGPAPPPPGPTSCGPDPADSPSDLGCEFYSDC